VTGVTTHTDTLNKEQAAKHLGVSVRTLIRLTEGGHVAHLPKRRKSDPTLYARAELDRYAHNKEAGPKYVSPVVTRAAPGEALEIVQPSALAPQSAARIIAALRALDSRPVWLTKVQAVEASGLPVTWIERAVKEGRLNHIGAGRAWRVHRDDVLALAESFRGDNGVTGDGHTLSHSKTEIES
jgi:hypothetical protein